MQNRVQDFQGASLLVCAREVIASNLSRPETPGTTSLPCPGPSPFSAAGTQMVLLCSVVLCVCVCVSVSVHTRARIHVCCNVWLIHTCVQVHFL